MTLLVVLAIGMRMSLIQDTTAIDRARALVDRGRVREAIRLLENRSRSEPSTPELAFLAQLQASTGAIPQAAASLQRALALAPEQRGLRTTRGAMLFELRRFDEAREELERVLKEDPRAPLPRYYLAAIYRSQGALDRALEMAEQAVALLPAAGGLDVRSEDYAPAAAARHLLAEIRFERGEDVEGLLKEVVVLEPSHASAHYLLAREFLRRGQRGLAQVELEKFQRIKRANEHLGRGRELSRMQGRRDEAIAEFRLAVESDPEHARALYALGVELLRAGRADEALAILERLARLRPETRVEVDRVLQSIR